jgi:SAM-dependent methyltransferase
MTPRSYEYLLGDSRVESARLRRQAALWDPTSHAFFDRLKIRRGMRVLEIGPGQGSLHVELRRRVRGPVDAVERSSEFARKLRATCRRDGLGEGVLWESDLWDAELPDGEYDVIFARWVFLFLPDVKGHLAKLLRALKPGGCIAIEDYLRDTFSMSPRPVEWDGFIAADRAFFATEGGDANIGARLPLLMRDAGLVVREATPTIKLARPGTPAWRWMSDYFLGIMDRYAGPEPFTKAGAARLRAHWLAAERSKTSLLVSPTVMDVVGRKKR